MAKILVIICAKNEEKSLGKCLKSLVSQSHKPERVIVVDDCSSDRTKEIAFEFASKNKMIEVVVLGKGRGGVFGCWISGVFNNGLKAINLDSFDYLSKIDADIILYPNYFEEIMNRFMNDKELGISGGIIINEPTREVCGGNMVISIPCWKLISDRGMMPFVGAEDTYLIAKARMNKFKSEITPSAKSFTTRPYKALSFKKKMQKQVNYGKLMYSFGYHPLYFAGRVIKMSIKNSPYLLTPILALFGWLIAWMGEKPYEKDLRNYIRTTQRQRFEKL